MTRSFLLPLIALPRISSDLPSEYMSAVSKKLMPEVDGALDYRARPSRSPSVQAKYPDFTPPKLMQPMQSRETLRPRPAEPEVLHDGAWFAPLP